MTNKIIFLSLLVFLFTNCSVEDLYIEDSVFISDPEIPGLPIYSEMGYNTFGVRYERDLIIQSSGSYPLKIIVDNNTTSFIFSGQKDWTKDFKLTININNYAPANLDGLMDLNQKTFDLTSNDIEIILEDNDNKRNIEVISGEFKVKKTQKLTVDKEEKGVILSGVFQFKAFVDDVPVAFSYGRYDVLLGYSNFFVIN